MKKLIILMIILSGSVMAQRPSVTTKQITTILENSAIVSGRVTSLSQYPVTEVGFSWSRTENPTRTRNDGAVYLDEGSTNYTAEITELEPETRYYVRMFASNENGIEYGQNVVFETLGFDLARSIDKTRLAEADLLRVDSDNDGVPNSFEEEGPNDGDANNDGIDDKTQTTVLTINEQNSQNLQTLVVTGCTALYNPTNESQIETSGYVFPYGVTQFITPCGASSVKIIYHNVSSFDGYVYRKRDANGEWFNYGDAEFGTEVIGGQQVATVTIPLSDGDPEDYDGLTNGQIHDPGGPAFLLQSSNIPVFNVYSRILLIGSLLAIAFFILKIRK